MSNHQELTGNPNPDPYFLKASDSEKEIIKELVKADVEAMLERDAVALLPSDREPKKDQEVPSTSHEIASKHPEQISKSQTKATTKKVYDARNTLTHWSYKAPIPVKAKGKGPANTSPPLTKQPNNRTTKNNPAAGDKVTHGTKAVGGTVTTGKSSKEAK